MIDCLIMLFTETLIMTMYTQQQRCCQSIFLSLLSKNKHLGANLKIKEFSIIIIGVLYECVATKDVAMYLKTIVNASLIFATGYNQNKVNYLLNNISCKHAKNNILFDGKNFHNFSINHKSFPTNFNTQCNCYCFDEKYFFCANMYIHTYSYIFVKPLINTVPKV